MKIIVVVILFIISFVSLYAMENHAPDIMRCFSNALESGNINQLLQFFPHRGLLIGSLATRDQREKLRGTLGTEQLSLDEKLRSWDVLWYGKPAAMLLVLAGVGAFFLGSYKFMQDGDILFAQEDESTPLFKTGSGLLSAAGILWAANPYRYTERRKKKVDEILVQLYAIPNDVGAPPVYDTVTESGGGGLLSPSAPEGKSDT